MERTNIIEAVDRYYTARLAEHGPSHWGVDWNSTESQHRRFDQVLRVIDEDDRSARGAAEDDQAGAFSLNDYGCGYGALASYLQERGKHVRYTGYDVSEAMIETARSLHAGARDVQFCTRVEDLPLADFTVASGIFNVKCGAADDEWRPYVLDTLAEIARHSRRGFAFNMLTDYADPERMRPTLYYASATEYFDYCRRTFSRFVALLHDYPLYEFTILVRFR